MWPSADLSITCSHHSPAPLSSTAPKALSLEQALPCPAGTPCAASDVCPVSIPLPACTNRWAPLSSHVVRSCDEKCEHMWANPAQTQHKTKPHEATLQGLFCREFTEPGKHFYASNLRPFLPWKCPCMHHWSLSYKHCPSDKLPCYTLTCCPE